MRRRVNPSDNEGRSTRFTPCKLERFAISIQHCQRIVNEKATAVHALNLAAWSGARGIVVGEFRNVVRMHGNTKKLLFLSNHPETDGFFIVLSSESVNRLL